MTESLFLQRQTHRSLRVAALGVHLASRFLHILLRLVPVLHPAAIELRGGAVALSRAAHRAVALRDVARLLGQLVLVDEAALLLAGVFGVGPRLLLPGCEEAVEHNAPVVHEGSNEEDVLPLFPGLQTQTKNKHLPMTEKRGFKESL